MGLNWKAKLTPRNTEEIKPNLFIQEYKVGDDLFTRLNKTIKGHQEEITYSKYKQITPAYWKGKINWLVLILGTTYFPYFLGIIIILLGLALKNSMQITEVIKLFNDPIYFRTFCDSLVNSTEPIKQICTRSIFGSSLIVP
jgi:hypothetical protein